MPRCVTQGVPSRMPVARAVTVSPGIVCLLTTMPANSRMRATTSPYSVSLPSCAGARLAPRALEIDQEQMRVRSPIGQLKVPLDQPAGQSLRVLDDAPLQILKRIAAGDLERHTHGGKLVGVRPALQARENGCVDLARQVCVGGQDARPSRAAQRLVRGKGDHVGNAHRVGILPGNHHARRMGNVGHQVGAHSVRDLAEPAKIGRPGIRRVPGNDQLGAGRLGKSADLVIVQRAIARRPRTRPRCSACPTR